MGCLKQKNAQCVEQRRTSMARVVRTVFELTGLESGGNGERWIAAKEIPIFKQPSQEMA